MLYSPHNVSKVILRSEILTKKPLYYWSYFNAISPCKFQDRHYTLKLVHRGTKHNRKCNFHVINKWNWNIKYKVILQMRAVNVLALQARHYFFQFYQVQPLRQNMILNILWHEPWNIANSLYVKGCFGAINVENEIEIEKFFGTNIIKLPFPYIVGHNSITPLPSLQHSFHHIKSVRYT